MRFAKPFFAAFALALIAFAAVPAVPADVTATRAILIDKDGDGKAEDFEVVRDSQGNVVRF
jgi:hypothetical protein